MNTEHQQRQWKLEWSFCQREYCGRWAAIGRGTMCIAIYTQGMTSENASAVHIYFHLPCWVYLLSICLTQAPPTMSCIPLVNICCNCCWSSGWEVTRITVIHMPTCISYVGRNVHIGETIKRADMLPEANPHLHHSPPLDHQTTQQPGQRLLSLPMEGFHLRARLVSDAVLPREGIPMLPLFCRGIIFAVVTGMLFEVVLIL